MRSILMATFAAPFTAPNLAVVRRLRERNTRTVVVVDGGVGALLPGACCAADDDESSCISAAASRTFLWSRTYM